MKLVLALIALVFSVAEATATDIQSNVFAEFARLGVDTSSLRVVGVGKKGDRIFVTVREGENDPIYKLVSGRGWKRANFSAHLHRAAVGWRQKARPSMQINLHLYQTGRVYEMDFDWWPPSWWNLGNSFQHLALEVVPHVISGGRTSQTRIALALGRR